ncbi:hypothetical protein V8F20_007258 [Naviculisporaceae sp. PSN 640]
MHIFLLELVEWALLEPSLSFGDWGDSQPAKDVYYLTSSSYPLNTWIWYWEEEIDRWIEEQKSPRVLRDGVNNFRQRFRPVQVLWADLKDRLVAFDGALSVDFLNNLVENVDEALEKLHEKMNEGNLRAEELDLGSGLSKQNSFSSGIGLPTPVTGQGIRSRTVTAIDGFELLSKRRRLQKKPLATYMCEAAETITQYDSNFYSTACQVFIGLAGIVAIIAPIITVWWKRLRGGRRRGMMGSKDEGIKTSNPFLFYSLLVFSFATLVASPAVYPYDPKASIPLGIAAGIAQNIATLLILEDTGNTILEQVDKIADLEYRIADLNRGRRA